MVVAKELIMEDGYGKPRNSYKPGHTVVFVGDRLFLADVLWC